MKGIIFNQLQEFVEQNHGLVAWDTALSTCQPKSEGVYVATQSYDDQELFDFVQYFSDLLNISSSDLIRAFGEFVFVRLFELAPKEAQEAENLRVFLMMIEDLIHVEVRKLYQDANLPTFEYQASEKSLLMVYRSPRKLCFLSEGLITAAAKHFDETIAIRQPQCMHEGAECCHIEIEFL